MRVVVIGAKGLLGSAIVREFARDHDVVPLDRRQLDVTDEAAVVAALTTAPPDVIVNGAAYNDVDGAEEDPVLALQVNAFAVRALASAARETGATLVHFSSDFVFDGAADRPYVEDDRPNPQSVYGASKLLGDWFALEAPRAYVLRVESLFGPASPDGSRRGSLGTLIERIRQGNEVAVFVDRTVSPSHTPDIARAVRGLLEGHAPAGLYHCVNSGQATWQTIAARIAGIVRVPLRSRAITLESAGLRARRPRYCALSNEKLRAAGIDMPSWEDALASLLATGA